jgi:Chaperone of endosialidase
MKGNKHMKTVTNITCAALAATANTAMGFGALRNNTGQFNTATGNQALFSNTTGINNTANGDATLFRNTTGVRNTADGAGALANHTNGNDNTAIGFDALLSNTTGSSNTAVGHAALLYSTSGGLTNNTASGDQALVNTTGFGNTAASASALLNNTSGHDNIALGNLVGNGVTTAANVICIGAFGANVSNSCFISNIFGITTATGTTLPVLVDNFGQLGTASSSRRFKKEIKPMGHSSEAILGLKPVTFQYKSDASSTPQFGLIAEEVAQVNPDLVVRDESGEIYTVRYDAVNAMLLNEFLKEHRRIQEQDKRIDQLTAQLKQQAALIQKVSDKVELHKPAPQTVDNNW